MRILRYGWIESTYLLFTSAYTAPQISSADRGSITQCVNASHDRNECVGIVADACIKAIAGDSYVEDAKACAARERGVWDERLQASLKSVNASFPALQLAIADAQSNWLKSLEGLCPDFDDIDPGMYVGGSEYCRLQETGRRALIIECMRVPRDKNGSAETCIDRRAGHCEMAKGEDEKACTARELADSRKRLQATVKTFGDVRETQSYWLKSREKLCPLFAVIDPGTDRVGSNRCRQLETSGRAGMLARMAEAVGEH
jgi:uncharacterized protein YecT (DUF1311 family)